ncbi:MAG TPA: hypothetical protein PK677_14740 [Acidiphilium sp.]|nr:hypothetical protein [Acidiphilium sp.]
MADLTRLFGHAAGGRPAERLMASLGLPQSDDTILRHLKRHAGAPAEAATVRVVGVDDWAWQLRYAHISFRERINPKSFTEGRLKYSI